MATVKAQWNEDGTATCLARLTARDATGSWTGVPGEGNFLKQADLSSITYSTFDRSSSTPNTAIVDAATVTISTAIQDTPVMTSVLWVVDTYGHNFVFDVPYTCFPTGGHVYDVEFMAITTGGARLPFAFSGTAKARSST